MPPCPSWKAAWKEATRDNPQPTAREVAAAVEQMLAHPGPFLVDLVLG